MIGTAFAWMKAQIAGLLIGFCLGVLWLLLLGIPFILPSYLSVRLDERQAQADKGAVLESFDTSEERRGEETGQCRKAVEEERNYWQTRIAEMLAAESRFEAPIGEDTGNDETRAHPPQIGRCVDVVLVPDERVRTDPDRPSPGTGPAGG